MPFIRPCAATDDEKDAGSAFKCDVCRKSFKSEQMLGQHENSKKHKEAVKKAGGRKKREDKRGEGQAAAVAPKKEEGWQEPESEDGCVDVLVGLLFRGNYFSMLVSWLVAPLREPA